MDALMTAAASGLRARLESLDMLANNIANQATAGYKADREFYSLYESGESTAGGGGLSPVIQENWTDHSQGALQRTGDPAHVALEGPGYFRVQSPSGELLTRSGAFRLSPAGRLVSADGYPLLDAGGKPAELDPREPFRITPEGEIQQRGRAAVRIGIAGVPDTAALKKHHGTYFHAPEGVTAGRARVLQEHLEGANVSGPESSIRLIEVLRQFESLQKAIHISGEMSKGAAEIARVGG